MTPNLNKKTCTPCQGGIPPLKGDDVTFFLTQLDSGWKVIDQHHIEKEFSFPNFVTALAFTNKVGAVAEEEGHHPDIHVSWGIVIVKTWTHKIDGLHENDFILASKVDKAYDQKE